MYSTGRLPRIAGSLAMVVLLGAAAAVAEPEPASIGPAASGPDAGLFAGGPGHTVDGPAHRSPAREVGSIRGQVTLNVRAPRRSARRYAGRPQQARGAQTVPAVAFLRGTIPGAPFQPGSLPTMTQQDTAFVPSVLYVPVGGTVSFPNGDPFFHNVFSYSSARRFDLGRYPQGQSKDVVFDEAGIVGVFCEVHEFMRAAIIVAENPFYSVVAEDGSFAIDDIPPGEYTLVVWHVDLGEVEEIVRVPDGGTAEIALELG